MSDVAIRVENIGKRYRIGQQEPYKSLRDVLTDAFTAPFRRWTKQNFPISQSAFRDPKSDHIWALKDISFEVKQGEVLGVIGRNGAGKTTLLKILSRTTVPTEGYAEINGRVGSLLEIGTGFHPELTGRENIYLNAAILGMKRREIDRKFDEIVAFSEIEKFLDTPVKHYSSGMYIRLAFGVAAHLEPEILIVDEVLAVGDAAFQKKCLGKMGGVAKGGRTVLFVSHNMVAIKTLCNRAILLQDGSLVADGIPNHVVNTYLGTGLRSKAECIWDKVDNSPGNTVARLHSVRVRKRDGEITSDIGSDCPFDIEIEYWNLVSGARLGATVVIYNREGVRVLASISNHEPKWYGQPHPIGLFRSVCRMPGNFLPEASFSVTVLLWADNYSLVCNEEDVIGFEIHESAGGVRGDYLGHWNAVVRPMLEWETELEVGT